MTYSQSHSSPSSAVQQSGPSAMSRLRAASSSAFPPGLDLRNQYRPLQTQHNSPHGTTPRSSSFASAFTGGYASAPLTAPVDFSLPRTPVDGSHGTRDFNIPQLSAPINPSQDFSSAYNSTISPARAQQGDRDFGSQGQNNGDQGQGQGSGQTGDQHQQQQQSRNNEEASYLTGQKRKRSFTISGPFESP